MDEGNDDILNNFKEDFPWHSQNMKEYEKVDAHTLKVLTSDGKWYQYQCTDSGTTFLSL